MNLSKIDFNNKNTFHLCLYKGIGIVAAACVEFDIPKFRATINSIRSTNSENEKVLKDKIHEWVMFHDLMLAK